MVAFIRMFLALAWVSIVPTLSHAAYPLDTGDVITVSVFGEEGYPVELALDEAGLVSLPLLGEISARGQTTEELRRAIEAAFVDRQIYIEPRVQVSIRQHRPFYISGAVAQPGGFPYRPNLRVREAIVLAGGIKVGWIGDTAPELQIADLRSEYQELQIESFWHSVQLQRLSAELDDSSDFIAPTHIPVGLDTGIISEIMVAERAQLQARRDDFRSDLAFIERSLQQAEHNITAFEKAQLERDQVLSLNEREVRTARALQEKGLATDTRVRAAEQSAIIEKASSLASELDRAELLRAVADLKQQRQQINEKHEIDIRESQQAAQLALARAETKMRHVRKKLEFVEQHGTGATLSDLGAKVRVSIHRVTNGTDVTIDARAVTPVEPGDVIEVLAPAPEYSATGQQGKDPLPLDGVIEPGSPRS